MLSSGGCHRRQSQGFTLIELVIALGIFSLLSAIAYGSLNQIIEAEQRTEKRSEQLRTLQMAVTVMRRDFNQMVPRPIQDGLGGSLPALHLTTSHHSDVEFTRAGFANPLQQRRSELQRVTYTVRNRQLIRGSREQLDPTGVPELAESPLLDGVEQFRIRCLDQQQRWHLDWPPPTVDDDPTPLPRATEISLSLQQYQGSIRLLFAGAAQ